MCGGLVYLILAVVSSGGAAWVGFALFSAAGRIDDGFGGAVGVGGLGDRAFGSRRRERARRVRGGACVGGISRRDGRTEKGSGFYDPRCDFSGILERLSASG